MIPINTHTDKRYAEESASNYDLLNLTHNKKDTAFPNRKTQYHHFWQINPYFYAPKYHEVHG